MELLSKGLQRIAQQKRNEQMRKLSDEIVQASHGFVKLLQLDEQKPTKQHGTVVNGEIVPDEPKTALQVYQEQQKAFFDAVVREQQARSFLGAGYLFPSIFDEPDETEHLNSTQANRENLEQSISELEAGDVAEHELAEPTGWQPKPYIEPPKQDMRIGLLVVAEDLLESRDMWVLIEKLQLVTVDIYDTPDGAMIKGHSPCFEEVREGESWPEYDVQLVDGELSIKRAE